MDTFYFERSPDELDARLPVVRDGGDYLTQEDWDIAHEVVEANRMIPIRGFTFQLTKGKHIHSYS
jgi:hypothetical protein